MLRELADDVRIDQFNVSHREQATSNARLVGHDEKQKSCILQSFQSRRSSSNEYDLLHAMEVVSFLHQNAVAIEKHSAIHSAIVSERRHREQIF